VQYAASVRVPLSRSFFVDGIPAERHRRYDGQYPSVNFVKKSSIFCQEIDTPGHTAIIAATYPDYVACFDASPWADFANEPPAGQLRFALPEVMNFTASLLTNIAETLPSYYFSTGGDELNTNCYANDYLTQQQLNSTGTTLNGALDTFTQTTHGALIAQGKTPVVWEGMRCIFPLNDGIKWRRSFRNGP
jgi:hexosaminidase